MKLDDPIEVPVDGCSEIQRQAWDGGQKGDVDLADGEQVIEIKGWICLRS
jgi:hypothetical protein